MLLANPVLRFGGDIRPSRMYPSPLPDLFKGEQLIVVGRYSGHGRAAVTIEGIRRVEVTNVTGTVENNSVAMWHVRIKVTFLIQDRLHE